MHVGEKKGPPRAIIAVTMYPVALSCHGSSRHLSLCGFWRSKGMIFCLYRCRLVDANSWFKCVYLYKYSEAICVVGGPHYFVPISVGIEKKAYFSQSLWVKQPDFFLNTPKFIYRRVNKHWGCKVKRKSHTSRQCSRIIQRVVWTSEGHYKFLCECSWFWSLLSAPNSVNLMAPKHL